MNTLPLSKLKGIKVYIENDLYEVTRLMLKLIDAKARDDGCTVNTDEPDTL